MSGASLCRAEPCRGRSVDPAAEANNQRDPWRCGYPPSPSVGRLASQTPSRTENGRRGACETSDSPTRVTAIGSGWRRRHPASRSPARRYRASGSIPGSNRSNRVRVADHTGAVAWKTMPGWSGYRQSRRRYFRAPWKPAERRREYCPHD